MSKHQTKTDHSYFEEKVRLRLDGLPDGNPLRVLDLFCGDGLLWNEIAKRSGRQIKILKIDRQKNRHGIYLQGDNRKFSLDYSAFDCVDLDSYGVPFDQLEKIFASPSRPKRIFITFIQSQWGSLPSGMLTLLGYPPEMVKKVPTLFYHHGQQKFLDYLALKNVTKCQIFYTPDRRKNYISMRNCL